jgi:diguanylate cyclase (GGDEF)-like protein
VSLRPLRDQDLTPGDPGPDQDDEAVNGWQETGASAGGTPADGHSFTDREQTFGDADQTSADSDQTAADSDQTAADSDQAAAESDQAAAESDQAASDRELEQGSDPQLHDATHKIRDRSAQRRQQTAHARIERAAARDQAARDRDLTAVERDQAAARRDRELAAREAGEPDRGQAATNAENRLRAARDRKDAAADRSTAAEGRVRAAADREQAARDRDQAAQDRAQSRADRDALIQQLAIAEIDQLTGARLRGPGLVELDHEIDRARRASGALVVAYVDVVGLKAVNDVHGHAAGDRMLQHAVRRIRTHLRTYDLIVRVGGDEFLCVMSGATIQDARQRFASVQTMLAADPDPLAIKVGFAALGPRDSAAELIQRADAELPTSARP